MTIMKVSVSIPISTNTITQLVVIPALGVVMIGDLAKVRKIYRAMHGFYIIPRERYYDKDEAITIKT